MNLRNGKRTGTALNVQTYLHNKKDTTDDISEITDNSSEYIDDISENTNESDDISEYVPTESIYSVGNSSSDFTNELLSLINSLKEIVDISHRLDIILDIYTYLDNHVVECANKPMFIKMLCEKSLNLYKDLAVTAIKHGKDVKDIIMLISTKIISVLAKIGEIKIIMSAENLKINSI